MVPNYKRQKLYFTHIFIRCDRRFINHAIFEWHRGVFKFNYHTPPRSGASFLFGWIDLEIQELRDKGYSPQISFL